MKATTAVLLRVGGLRWWLQVGASENQKKLDNFDFADKILCCCASGELFFASSAGQWLLPLAEVPVSANHVIYFPRLLGPQFPWTLVISSAAPLHQSSFFCSFWFPELESPTLTHALNTIMGEIDLILNESKNGPEWTPSRVRWPVLPQPDVS